MKIQRLLPNTDCILCNFNRMQGKKNESDIYVKFDDIQIDCDVCGRGYITEEALELIAEEKLQFIFFKDI